MRLSARRRTSAPTAGVHHRFPEFDRRRRATIDSDLQRSFRVSRVNRCFALMIFSLPPLRVFVMLGAAIGGLTVGPVPVMFGQRSAKPMLHGKHWVAITGKPLAATAGAMTFAKGGNAVDATCAMLAAACTMWDTLGWGGETQALIYNPQTQKVIGINALGFAPSGATVEFYRRQKMAYPPEYGPLAAVTPGTPGGLLTMLAEYGTMSLAEVLAPSHGREVFVTLSVQAENETRGERGVRRLPGSRSPSQRTDCRTSRRKKAR